MPLDDIRAWLGRSQTVEDFLAPWPAKALIATLDERDPEPRMGDPLPPLWHWLYFLEAAPASTAATSGSRKTQYAAARVAHSPAR